MEYRRLGGTGLQVSALSYGTWVTAGDQVPESTIRECLGVARNAGITTFDTAETYAGGRAEEVLGRAFEQLGWDRSSFILVTKLYWGITDWPHLRRTLNRKYLLQGVDGCLQRLRTGYVDLLLCHRRDPETSIEEVVWTMSDIVASGKAVYWGTSKWPAADVREACAYADRMHLRRPVLEQPEYNLLTRGWVERDYEALGRDLGIGLMTWSPLASGLLTGKYATGVPAGSRAALPAYSWLGEMLSDREKNRRVAALAEVARDLGCSTSQLSIAWCLGNRSVSSVILGASGPDQLRHNLGALEILPELTQELRHRLAAMAT